MSANFSRRLDDGDPQGARAQGESSKMHSIALIKSMCPTCIVLGLAMMPFEFLWRVLQPRA